MKQSAPCRLQLIKKKKIISSLGTQEKVENKALKMSSEKYSFNSLVDNNTRKGLE